MLMPGTDEVARRNRAITCWAVSFRPGLSRSMMKMRPELTVAAALPETAVWIDLVTPTPQEDKLVERLLKALRPQRQIETALERVPRCAAKTL